MCLTFCVCIQQPHMVLLKATTAALQKVYQVFTTTLILLLLMLMHSANVEFNGRVIESDKSNTQINAISKAQKQEMHPQVNHFIFSTSSTCVTSHYLFLWHHVYICYMNRSRCNAHTRTHLCRYKCFSNEFWVGVVVAIFQFSLVCFGSFSIFLFTSIWMIFPSLFSLQPFNLFLGLLTK